MENRVHIEPAGLGAEERQTSAEGSGAFTPGPWEIDAGFLVTRAFAGGVGIPIIQLLDPSKEAGFCTGTQKECEANASLIAAAPDLYRALKELLAAVQYNAPPIFFQPDNPCWDARVPVDFTMAAEAALARAVGQDPASLTGWYTPAHASRSDVTASEGEVSPGTNS